MTRRSWRWGSVPVLTALLVAALAGAVAAAPKGAAGKQRSAAVAAAVREVMAQYEIPGVIVGVWQRGQAPIVKALGTRNFDLASAEPGHAKMAPSLYMRIGSETKTFTATALLQLVEAGKVKLDDPISRYVPGVPNGGAITVRELAEMRSGIASYSKSEAWLKEFLAAPKRVWQPRELLAAAFAQPPSFAPGARFEYSNTNYILLGLLVEKVSGEAIGPYIERHILAPLHMTHTLFPHGSEYPKPHANGYTIQTPTGAVADSTGWDPSWAWAAGAMISNLHDLRIWAKAVATGMLLKPAIQRQRERFVPATGLAPVRYGLGLFEDDGWVGHDGEVPGFESLTLYLPAQRATLVILLNSDVDPEQSKYLGEAVTKVITPAHVFTFGAPNPLAP